MQWEKISHRKAYILISVVYKWLATQDMLERMISTESGVGIRILHIQIWTLLRKILIASPCSVSVLIARHVVL
jgi:hypothetical protein